MLNQTADNLIPLLQMLQQPAFCIRDDGTVICNRSARHLAPYDASGLIPWLGTGAAAYGSWNQTDVLVFPLQIQGSDYSVTINRLIDGTLFLLTDLAARDASDSALAVASQVLRQPLNELSATLQRTRWEDPKHPRMQSAILTRQVYQLSRLTSNLADISRLRSGTYLPRMELLDINAFLQPIFEELSHLCRSIDRAFLWKLPAKSAPLQGDPILLERAILNLMSNALKFGQPDTEIHLLAEIADNTLRIRITNQCLEDSAELLRSAFNRLEQRDVLPDPKWGIGLGLPITQYIARIHGGMVVVEASDEKTAAVTFSVTRRRTSNAAVLESPAPVLDYSGGMRRSLLELSDVLPSFFYDKYAL